jgi:hypothetical protein
MSEDRTPTGFWKLDAYTNGCQIVVLGEIPYKDDYDENDPNEHNCDEQGCGSFEHVLCRIPVMSPMPQLNWANPEYLEMLDKAMELMKDAK